MVGPMLSQSLYSRAPVPSDTEEGAVPAMPTQRSVLVTGGAAGIGLAIARGFAALGHRVLLADLSEDVHAVAEGLSTPAAPVHAERVDIGDEAQLMRVVERAKALFGGCDILVNCAGISSKRNGLPTPPTEV